MVAGRSAGTTPQAVTWTAIVPVKRLALAKTRLHLADAGREDLALAFALDAIAALLDAQRISRIVVVTDDRRARHAIDDAFTDHVRPPVSIVPDVPDAGLNTALMHGAHTARELSPTTAVVAVSADLPALRATEVDAFLAHVEHLEAPCAFLSDASGTGTTMLTAAAGHELHPQFGRRSRAAHRADGAIEVDLDAPGARRDVDTLVDLWDARRMGVGPATTDALAHLPGAL
jgi:2-phospho-L-lactate guanylyltransferase